MLVFDHNYKKKYELKAHDSMLVRNSRSICKYTCVNDRGCIFILTKPKPVSNNAVIKLQVFYIEIKLQLVEADFE